MCLQKGVVPRDVVYKYEVNMFTNKEVMANVKVFRKFYGQGHQRVWLLNGVVPRNVVSKYEVNMFANKEVMTNVKVFGRND